MIDFDEMCVEMRKKVQVLIAHTSVFAWEDFGGEGNACWNPHVFSNTSERKEDALALASAKVVIPYDGQEHRLLSERISNQLGNEYVTYPWLIQAVAYVLNGVSIQELQEMISISNRVRAEKRLQYL